MTSYVRDSLHLTARLLAQTIRLPVFIAISLVQPVIWLLLFGALFQRVAELQDFNGSYLDFLAPGIAVMAALFGSAYAGMAQLEELNAGITERILATPVSRAAMVTARVLQAAVSVALQATLIVLLAVAFGADLPGGWFGALLAVLAATLLGAVVGAASNALALLARRQELIFAITNFILLPATFVSTILIEGSLMPEWMDRLRSLNPVDWAAVVARGAFEGAPISEYGGRLVLLALAAVGACALTRLALRAYEKQT